MHWLTDKVKVLDDDLPCNKSEHKLYHKRTLHFQEFFLIN